MAFSAQPIPLNRRTKLSAVHRKQVALDAVSKRKTITALAGENKVCRKTIRKVRDKANAAIEIAFDNRADETVLFYLPVTKHWIRQFVLALLLIARASYRDIIMILQELFDTPISVGTINNIYEDAAVKAQGINNCEDLSNIIVSCTDELYHQNKPVLAEINSRSLYCFLLSREDHRDEDTWAIHLLDAKDKGLLANVMVSDEAKGLLAAHQSVFFCTEYYYDNFHLTRLLMNLRRFYRNRLRSSITARTSLEKKIENGFDFNSGELETARQHEEKMQYLSTTISTLVSWLEHDVLKKAGANYQEREVLFDFIVDEFQHLAQIEPHRLKSVCTTLVNKKESALKFVTELENRLEWIALQNLIPIDTVWRMCDGD